MNNLRASLLMVAAMAGFAVEDVIIKQLSATLGLPQRRLAAHRFAAMLGLTQARLNALLTGRLAQFGADALIALATKRGSTCG